MSEFQLELEKVPEDLWMYGFVRSASSISWVYVTWKTRDVGEGKSSYLILDVVQHMSDVIFDI